MSLGAMGLCTAGVWAEGGIESIAPEDTVLLLKIDNMSATVERAMVAQLHRSYRIRGKKLTVRDVAKHHGLSHVPKED